MPDIRPDKKVVEDIVPSKRRTIRNVSFGEENEDIETRIPLHITPRKPRKNIPPYREDTEEVKYNKPKLRRKISGTIVTFAIVFICIAIIAVALSLLYSKAVVTIIPKTAPIQVDGTFTAKKVALNNELTYEIVTVKATSSMSVPATNGPLVQTKAKGTAYIYNEQLVPQKIVAGTRLSNKNNLIYRTGSTITIPAGKVSQGKTVPGSIAVSLVADQPGTEYNMLISDLTGDLKVVAYKGGDKYSKVYGRIKTDVTGGFLGNTKIISPEAKKSTVESIQNTLKNSLSQKITNLVPKNSILYKNATIFEYQVSDLSGKASSTAEISVTGTAYGITFNSDVLLKFIGAKELEKFPTSSYITKGLENLSFSVVNTKDFSAKKGSALIFTLKGPLTLIGTFSEEKLKGDLKGISLEQSNAVFAHYSSIGSAHALITPFWMRSFPNSTEKIILELKSE